MNTNDTKLYSNNSNSGTTNREISQWASSTSDSSRFTEELDSEKLALAVEKYEEMHALAPHTGKKSHQHVVAMVLQLGGDNEALETVLEFVEKQHHDYLNNTDYFSIQSQEELVDHLYNDENDDNEFIVNSVNSISYAPKDCESAIKEYQDNKNSTAKMVQITERLKRIIEIEAAKLDARVAENASKQKLVDFEKRQAEEKMQELREFREERKNEEAAKDEAKEAAATAAAANPEIEKPRDPDDFQSRLDAALVHVRAFHEEQRQGVLSATRKTKVATFWKSKNGKSQKKSIYVRAAWASHKTRCFLANEKVTSPKKADYEVAKTQIKWMLNQESRAQGIKAKAIHGAAELVAIQQGKKMPHHSTLRAWDKKKKIEAKEEKIKLKKQEERNKIMLEQAIDTVRQPGFFKKIATDWKAKSAAKAVAKAVAKADKAEIEAIRADLEKEDEWGAFDENQDNMQITSRKKAVAKQNKKKEEDNTPEKRRERALERQAGLFSQIESLDKPLFANHRDEMKSQGIESGEYFERNREEIIKEYENKYDARLVIKNDQVTVHKNSGYGTDTNDLDKDDNGPSLG
jgi:hypothetical protein